jgi:hypothetical protein
VFLAGATIGGFGGYFLGVRKAFRPPAKGEMSARMAEFARAKLHLTDEQLKQVRPILDDTSAEFESAFASMAERVNETITRANQRIAPLLTPEQKVLLEDLDRQRRDRFRDAFKQEEPK